MREIKAVNKIGDYTNKKNFYKEQKFMTAVKKKFLVVLLGMITLLAGFAMLTSCGNDKADDLKVTFMVQDDDTSEWKQIAELTAENGAVELPTVSKQYYTFANWYDNKEFTGSPFTGKNVTASVTAYARFIPVEVNVHINGIDQGTQNLIDVVKGTYNPGEGLEFDGWYTNANYTTPWDNKTETNDLYAKSVARITFNDGYQDVYTTTVNPGTVYESPVTQEAKTEEGETSTVEKACVWKNYMSAHDISYVDENGKEFDFTKAIEKNTVITVKWRSPFLKYQLNELTGNLSVTMYGNDGSYDDTENTVKVSDAPVISVLGKITFDKDGDGVAETYTVESIRLEQDILGGASLKKVIVGEGIVSLQNLVSSASAVEEVVLPSSLKVIQNSFNNLNKLKGIDIPNGVEVIIGSFWANTYTSHNGYGQYNKGEQYSFDIAIPESVKNLSMIPNNLTFAHTKENAKAGDFYKDGDCIYKIDDRTGHSGDIVLVSDVTDSSVVTVAEGVKGIQVGTYFNRTLDYITLPSTFSYVSYNEDISGYPAAAFQYSSKSFLFDKQYANDVKGNIAPTAYAIFSSMESLTLLNIKQADYPATLPSSAFIGDPTGWAVLSETLYEFCDATSLKDKVVYTGESDTPVVSINYINKLTGETYQATLNKTKGQKLSIEELLEAIDAEHGTALKADYEDNKLAFVSLKNVGNDYDIGATLTANVYLDATFNYAADGGYVAEDNGDGTATVTGFDAQTTYSAGDGLKIVVIPQNVTVGGKSLKVTKIGAEAFANNAEIGYVLLPATLKEIGAKAFYNCASLKEVDMSACKVEKIGASAFEGSAITSITLALSDMKEIGAYAFKVQTLMMFNVAAGEENRAMTTKTDLKAGEFFFSYGNIVESIVKQYQAPIGIYQYVSKSTVSEGESSYVVWDVKFVASAGGYNANEMSCQIDLGDISDEANIVRYEVMEGSYYFFSEETKLYFRSVSKIHANAFTNCENENLSGIRYSSKYMGSAISGRKKLSELVNDENCASVFEEGWYEGYTDEGLGSYRMSAI